MAEWDVGTSDMMNILYKYVIVAMIIINISRNNEFKPRLTTIKRVGIDEDNY